MTQNPKVSVCLPSYNQPDLLKQAIKSVLTQTFKDFEIIISDDCSPTDLTPVADAFNDKRIKFFRQKKNLGFIKNWNFCAKKSKGEYMKMMGHDDILLPKCLETEVSYLDKNPNVGLTCANYHTIDGDSKIVKTKIKEPFRLFKKDTIENGESLALNYFLKKRRVGLPSAILFRTSLLSDISFFDETIGCPVDIDTWLKMTKKMDFCYIDSYLLKYRYYAGNLSKEILVQPLAYREELEILSRHLPKCSFFQKLLIIKIYFVRIAYYKFVRLIRFKLRPLELLVAIKDILKMTKLVLFKSN